MPLKKSNIGTDEECVWGEREKEGVIGGCFLKVVQEQ
jgi:hypothetical protein